MRYLVGVTGGLSFAFLITLLGLATSLIIMFITSALQNREERIYSEIQQNVMDWIVPALQKTAPEESSLDAEKRIIEETFSALRERGLALVREVQERQEAFQKGALQWGGLFEAEMEAGAAKVGKVFEQLSGNQETANQRFLENFRQIQQALDAQIPKLAAATLHQTQALLDQQHGIAGAMSQQAEIIRSANAVIGELARAIRDFSGDQRLLQDLLRNFHDQLKEAGLSESLSGLREALLKLAPLLESLTKPFIWQPMPASTAGIKS